MADKALSFHWRTDADALPFLARAATDATVRSIVAEAILVCRSDPEQWISYSRRKVFYRRTRYRRTTYTYTYTSVIRAVDFCDEEGWLEHRKSPPGILGWQSTFCAEGNGYDEEDSFVFLATDDALKALISTLQREAKRGVR